MLIARAVQIHRVSVRAATRARNGRSNGKAVRQSIHAISLRTGVAEIVCSGKQSHAKNKAASLKKRKTSPCAACSSVMRKESRSSSSYLPICFAPLLWLPLWPKRKPVIVPAASPVHLRPRHARALCWAWIQAFPARRPSPIAPADSPSVRSEPSSPRASARPRRPVAP